MEAFDKLKQVVATEPMLWLSGFEKAFEVNTDAPNKAITLI